MPVLESFVSVWTAHELRRALEGIIARIHECEEELNALDAELGDGDLGSTLVSVAGAAERVLPALPDDLGAALTQLAQAIGGVSGSSFSGLLMLGLSRAGTTLRGKYAMDVAERAEAWHMALTAMVAASGSALGDKTMLDVIAAIATADPAANLINEVHRTLERYRSRPCRAGRARVSAERSIGRDDPGMVAMLRLVEGATGQRARTPA